MGVRVFIGEIAGGIDVFKGVVEGDDIVKGVAGVDDFKGVVGGAGAAVSTKAFTV